MLEKNTLHLNSWKVEKSGEPLAFWFLHQIYLEQDTSKSHHKSSIPISPYSNSVKVLSKHVAQKVHRSENITTRSLVRFMRYGLRCSTWSIVEGEYIAISLPLLWVHGLLCNTFELQDTTDTRMANSSSIKMMKLLQEISQTSEELNQV